MSGSVTEFAADHYSASYYQVSPSRNPTGPAEKTLSGVVIRGGSFIESTPASFRVLGRGGLHPKASVPGVGFRCAKSANDATPVRSLAVAETTVKPPAPPAATASAAGKPGLDAATCGDPCALLTLYPYDELVKNACRICKKHDKTFCETDFPFSDVPACEAYDELRNCIYARFGYVFSKPKWQRQFGKLPWYKPDPSFTEAKLPAAAKANVRKLKDLKAKKQGCQ
jgi:hypothetical protein